MTAPAPSGAAAAGLAALESALTGAALPALPGSSSRAGWAAASGAAR